MARRRKSSGLFAVVLVIVLLLLLWMLFEKTQNDEALTVFCDGKILTAESELRFNPEKSYTFSIIDKTATDGQSFSVHLAVHQSDATFTVDGRQVSFASLQDMTDDFIKDVAESSFVLSQELTLKQLLSDKFDGKTVSVPAGHLFDIVITSADGSYVIKIPLYFVNTVESIDLDNLHIVF